MTLMLTGWMLYSLWIVLGLMALDFLVGLFRSLRVGDFFPSLILDYLRDMLFYVLPLLNAGQHFCPRFDRLVDVSRLLRRSVWNCTKVFARSEKQTVIAYTIALE